MLSLAPFQVIIEEQNHFPKALKSKCRKFIIPDITIRVSALKC